METTHTHESLPSLSSTCENTRSVLDLPDIFMISVFRKFSLKELLKCACVCKKWNQLIRDGSLWRRIDLSPYKSTLTLGDVEKLISVYATDATRYVSLVGNYVEDSSTSSNVVVIEEEESNRRRLSSFLFTHIDERFVTHALASRARALTHLSLSHLDVSTIDFDTLVRFTRLDTLTLAWCNLNPHWFRRNNPSSGCLLDLKHFFLIRCCGISLDSDDITRICSTAPDLRTLCINQSQSSLGDNSVDVIVAHLHALENLSLNNTLITDAAVERICASEHMCAHLKTLNLARSSSLSNRCLEPIGACLSNLKSLHLTSCFGISNAVALANFAQLSYLNLNNTSIEKDKIRELLVPALAQCEIEFGHEKMLNRKLMWTINGSRNCVCSF